MRTERQRRGLNALIYICFATGCAITGTKILSLDQKDLDRDLKKAFVDDEAMEDPKDDNGENDKQ